ncbi:Organic hydroperoxide resistance protein-like 2 [Planococcus antarcticus DSM 14505]|uniref:Organic hydroperoxide resistance protein-like 2 n=1 Tax=Planococcus antarcticus DSM 14505 TaxID=1185653 RepID=A0A1C7DE47_9BACL|nr:Ohr family peroxiredoxin [Planococcus antarcticus]ANU09551.1 osmotically inducible protein C [Planococcus antarcticus DSM 14505]EIM08248.1 Organic hydroperoxide resistance protein-like 2 [Planococcus antarcticus DSM 14505]
MKTLFETTMTNTGGRDGAAYSLDNIFYLDVAKPQALGGSATTATNPEQLLAAGYSACFNSALELVPEAGKVEIEKSEVIATVAWIGDKDNGGVKLAVKLVVDIIGIDEELKKEYVEKAHQYCPYSKAIKESVDMETSVL